MPNRRYHIHVVCAANDQLLVLDRVAIFFQSFAFLTYDVSSKLPQAALYGRRCIDACDYTVVVVGDTYGATHNTGVSQLHLSYLSAKAKLKPMLVLIKTQHEGAEVSRQLQNFTRLVEQQPRDTYYYDESANIDKLLAYAYGDLTERYPATGYWMRGTATDTAPKPNLPPPSTTVSSAAPSTVTSSAPSSASAATKRANNPPPIEASIDSITETLVLTDTFDFQYTAHAYEGGNLTDVSMTLSCTWHEILQALIKIPAAFTSYGLQSCINRLITSKADHDIKQLMPNVHAVSRCQASQNDLLILQRLLVAANWIQLTASGARASQELWKLTFYAKKIFENSQPKSPTD